jgi:phosphoglucomutase/phosphomannomutase
MLSVQDASAALTAAQTADEISAAAAERVALWLTDPSYADFVPLVIEHVENGQWAKLNDVFWTTIPFGTAGRRGPMYPIGTNAINDRTIGESAQGLADFVRKKHAGSEAPRCAIAYDTRHRSRHFAELSAEIMAAAGFKVFFLNGHRSTPELSFTVRAKQCDCGIMVSASHNPPQDNAVKVFGPNGGQLRPPDDEAVMQCVERCREVLRIPFAELVAAASSRRASAGQIEFCEEEMDQRYRAAVLEKSFPGPRDLSILYSPLHGVGLTSVLPVLEADGFKQIEVSGPHSEPNGDFPNVPGGIANPENPAVFDSLIERAQQIDADLVVASDPDADRIGAAARLIPGGAWKVLTGNQIGALLADFILRRQQAIGLLSPDHYIIKTLVTSDMACRIAARYGVKCYGDVLTGFKWIGGLVDDLGPERFVFGFEEAHGYLVGDYVRDKDAAGAAMLLAELGAELKEAGLTLHQELDRLYRLVGYHTEFTEALPLQVPLVRKTMARLRENSPATLGDLSVRQIRDYELGLIKGPSGETTPLPGPRSDLLIFDLDAPGNRVAIRPSGTEPKLKFYFFAWIPPGKSFDLERARADAGKQINEMSSELFIETRLAFD